MSICATVKAAWYDEAVGRKRGDARRRAKLCGELELELIHTQKKLMLQAEVYARALLASQNVERAEVWVDARCAWWVGGRRLVREWKALRTGWRDV
jgi:hypothetical protein